MCFMHESIEGSVLVWAGRVPLPLRGWGTDQNSVGTARHDLGMGHRTQDPGATSSIPELLSGLVELMDVDDDQPGGFMRWIPRFLRKGSQ